MQAITLKYKSQGVAKYYFVAALALFVGQIVFGIGCGVLTVLIRYFGGFPEGVTFAILIMNTCAWFLDKLNPQRQFGVSKEDIKNAKAEKKAAKKAAKEAA